MAPIVTLLVCLAALVATCVGRVPSGYILKVKPACGSVSSQDAHISIITDLNVEAVAICANGREVRFTSTDKVNFELLVSYPSHGNQLCVFEKRLNTLVFVVKVLVSYGATGRFIHQEREEYTVSCTFDPHGRDNTANQNIVEGLIAPSELQTNLGIFSNSTFHLEMVNVLGASLAATNVHLGRQVSLKAVTSGTVGIRPVSCDAIDGTIRYAILRAGCGDGIIFNKEAGFITDGNSTTSPYFRAFSINYSPVVRFECNFITCDLGICDGSSCTNSDFDECLSDEAECDEYAVCTNTINSYECDCFNGFDGNGFTCVDLDECLIGSICHQDATCINTNGSYICTCHEGFTGDGLFCNDIDECLNTNCSVDCLDTIGSIDDDFSGDGLDCNDLSCVANTTCNEHSTCVNTIGFFVCSCDHGYSGNGFSCNDVDECSNGDATCTANEVCTNTIGLYTCDCINGVSFDGITCNEIIDECASGLHTCSSQATCTDTIGSFQCSCDNGYTGDGHNCLETDECANGEHVCHPNAFCTNTAGSYICTCVAGYVGDGVSCIDLNECDSGVAFCDYNCSNTFGSYACSCNAGYIGDGITCIDINECLDGHLHNCLFPAICSNRPGGFICQCNVGFIWNGIECKELINECTSGLHTCSAHATCTDTLESFQCICNNGFIGDGHTCIAENCLSIPCPEWKNCVGINGSFSCECKPGTLPLADLCVQIPFFGR